MTRWEVFRFVGNRLAAGLVAREAQPPAPDMPWPLVVEAADRHMVAAALGWCLTGDQSIPADVRQCFQALLELNRRRNDVIHQALEAAVGSLNAAGIVPMLLKGAAALAEPLYPDHGMRVVGDLDLLVSRLQVPDAEAALARAGFALDAPPESFDRDPHHRPPLVHADLRVRVDLHTRPMPDALHAAIEAAQMLSAGRVIAWRAGRVLLPDPADWVVHTILHGQIVDGHYWRGIPRLRQVLEVALLTEKHPEVPARIGTDPRWRGTFHGRVLTETLLLTDVLLGRRETDTLDARETTVLERLRRAVERPGRRRWSVYGQFLMRNARRAIEQPRFLMRPLRPSFWARYGATIRKGSQMGRW
jgi:hypothetical protein